MQFEYNKQHYKIVFQYDTALTGSFEWTEVEEISHWVAEEEGFNYANVRVLVRKAESQQIVRCMLWRKAVDSNEQTEVANAIIRVNPKLGYVKENLRREAMTALLAAMHGLGDHELSRKTWQAYADRKLKAASAELQMRGRTTRSMDTDLSQVQAAEEY